MSNSVAVDKLLTVFPEHPEQLQGDNATWYLILQLLNSDQTGSDGSTNVFEEIFNRLATVAPRNHYVVRQFAEFCSQYEKKFSSHVPSANFSS
ncbi:MAG TPA: hypothetical protein VMJ32_12880 [Pirellulales bacterium]|nr:hypothetical protein [Pirellulales bacterium]